MISLATFIGFAIALAFAYYSKRRNAIIVFTACFISLVVFGTPIGTNPLINSIQGDYLETDKVQWKSRNLIMVLGMGTSEVGPNRFEPAPLSYGRIAHAAIAYKSCRQTGAECKVIVSGGPTNHKAAMEAAVYAHAMSSIGVPSADMILENRSVSTWENAQNCSAIAKKHPEYATYLVTSGIHMRRALLYYAHFGMHPTPIRADHIEAWPTILPLAYNFSLSDVVAAEYRGLIRYRVYNALGLNNRDPKSPPGAANPIP